MPITRIIPAGHEINPETGRVRKSCPSGKVRSGILVCN
jgi:hypothetical protein